MESFSLDRPKTEEQIAQYASQLEQLPPNLQMWLQERWQGEQNDDYCRGLITAYSNVIAMCQSMEPAAVQMSVGQFLSFVSEKYREST